MIILGKTKLKIRLLRIHSRFKDLNAHKSFLLEKDQNIGDMKEFEKNIVFLELFLINNSVNSG